MSNLIEGVDVLRRILHVQGKHGVVDFHVHHVVPTNAVSDCRHRLVHGHFVFSHAIEVVTYIDVIALGNPFGNDRFGAVYSAQ